VSDTSQNTTRLDHDGRVLEQTSRDADGTEYRVRGTLVGGWMANDVWDALAQVCVPAEGAEDGSWHWLRHGDHFLAAKWDFVRPWRRFDAWYLAGREYGHAPQELVSEGYTYSHPASPSDATDLAAARAEIERQKVSGIEIDLSAAKRELEALRAAVSAIRRTPAMPFPDPGAHSWEAFARRVHKAWNDIQKIANAAGEGKS
jgi:hypothetical protein